MNLICFDYGRLCCIDNLRCVAVKLKNHYMNIILPFLGRKHRVFMYWIFSEMIVHILLLYSFWCIEEHPNPQKPWGIFLGI